MNVPFGKPSNAGDEADERIAPALSGKRLTTAEILYHLPDHPGLLQTFVWQYWDRAPHFPRLVKFLDFWAHNLDATLHSVRVAQAGMPSGSTVRRAVWHEFLPPRRLH